MYHINWCKFSSINSPPKTHGLLCQFFIPFPRDQPGSQELPGWWIQRPRDPQGVIFHLQHDEAKLMWALKKKLETFHWNTVGPTHNHNHNRDPCNGLWNNPQWQVSQPEHGKQFHGFSTKNCLTVRIHGTFPCKATLMMFVCFFVSLFVCLSVCLPACLFVCLCVCLFVCLSVCLSACLFVWLVVCLSVCLSACLPVCLFVCLFVCLSVGLFVGTKLIHALKSYSKNIGSPQKMMMLKMSCCTN